MSTPQEIIELVEKFNENAEEYSSSGYKEMRLRADFIDPFFAALGWDMRNEERQGELYREVVYEDTLKIGNAPKAPDYSFRVGSERKFFVETKAPSINLQVSRSSAFQLRRYAWSANLPLSILTNFRQFSVYDGRAEPKESDETFVARHLYFTNNEYLSQWDTIAKIFSREAAFSGALDDYTWTLKSQRGSRKVDTAFLNEIESWRVLLAKSIAANNTLTVRELNESVQLTIDRIIFLRICEDRGIEPYGRLKTLSSGSNIYQDLCHLFRLADQRYNSGLFHFEEERTRSSAIDDRTLNLKIDNTTLTTIIRHLYYPDSPYEFSVMSADILGQVYEQFLGKIIKQEAGGSTSVEEKPEVKKAGGVYYTPTYIVDYIVKQTVGALCEGKTPEQVSKLRVLDPACGSGSFLLGAYQYLLNWHRNWYLKNETGRHLKKIYQTTGGEWQLTAKEKKRILLNNIYGVDVDAQAVEVTKLSLSLKVLEGENSQSISENLRLHHERALPDLASNIKCGNSLIDADYLIRPEAKELGEEARNRVNVFDWQNRFPSIMEKGGFEAVIGNPPYIRVRSLKEFAPEQISYLESRYSCATHVWDIYLLFFERSLKLLKKDGRLSFIVPIQTLHQPNCESLRRLLYEETAIEYVIDLSHIKVFQEAIVKNCILTLRKGAGADNKIRILQPKTPAQLATATTDSWPQNEVGDNPGFSLKLSLLSPQKSLCEKLRERSWVLEELCYVTFGLRSSAKGIGQGTKERLITDEPHAEHGKPYLEGRDIDRYLLKPTGRYIRYIPDQMYSARSPSLFENKKIVSRSMLSKMRLVAALDTTGYYAEQSLICILPHGLANDETPSAKLPLEYILGLINSRLQTFYFATYIIDYSLGGGLIHATPGAQAKLVIPKAEQAQIKQVVDLVERLQTSKENLSIAVTNKDKETFREHIDSLDSLLDQVIYELYGLSAAEIDMIKRTASDAQIK